jgi:hypothetical protein
MDIASAVDVGLKGAFIAVALDTTLRCLYKGFYEGTLISRARITVGCCFLATSITNFLLKLPLGSGCGLNARISIVVFHVAMVLGESLQMYRISIITNNNKWFVSLATILMLLRSGIGIADMILSNGGVSLAPDETFQHCIFNQNQFTGITYVGMDAMIELFITTAITSVLFLHTRELIMLKQRTKNALLYRTIIETNVFRTCFLFLVNLLTLLMVLLNSDSVWLGFLWSILGISYLYFVIYDKNMVRFLQNLGKSDAPQDPYTIRQSQLRYRGSTLSLEDWTQIHHGNQQTTSTTPSSPRRIGPVEIPNNYNFV